MAGQNQVTQKQAARKQFVQTPALLNQAAQAWSLGLLIRFVQVRRAIVEAVIAEKERSLEKAPEGQIHCSKHNNNFQYYLYQPDERSETYVNDRQLIHRIVQKDYDEKALKQALKEKKALDWIEKNYPDMPESVYGKLVEGRQRIVTPVMIPDDEYIRNWESAEFMGNQYYPERLIFPTDRGEMVRSKSEQAIANYLYKLHIPYKYEASLTLHGLGRGDVTIYPDFTILNVRRRTDLYYEHFGQMGRSEYSERAVEKLAIYQRNGIVLGDRLVATFESSQCPFTQEGLKEIAEKFFL